MTNPIPTDAELSAAYQQGYDDGRKSLQPSEEQAMWFSTGSGRIELQITKAQAEGASHQGQCDDDVKALAKVPAIARQLAKIDPALLRSELREYGAWDSVELTDHEQNLQRLLWVACGDIADNLR